MQLGNAVHHNYSYQLVQDFFSEPKEKRFFFKPSTSWLKKKAQS